MEPISEENYLNNIKPLLLKVFNDSIFYFSENVIYPFSDSIEASAFLYTYGNDEPFNTQVFWNFLRDAILKLGDDFIYEVRTPEEYCNITRLQYGKDCKMSHSVYRAIISSSGVWGVYESIQGIAFLGGSQSFVNCIRQSFPEMDRQFIDFLTDWKNMEYWTDNSWLPELLLQIYGEEKTKELLEEAQEMGVYYNLLAE
jgi:hypothetical protein